MNPVLPDEAVEFGAAAAKAFAALGGVDAARRAEDDPATRTQEVAGALLALGAEDLDPRDGPEALAAAAALCEAAGRCALPYPVAGTLLTSADGRPFAVVPDRAARVDHGDLFGEWRITRLAGPATVATRPEGVRPLGTRLGPFVTDLVEAGQNGAGDGDAARDVALHLALTACSVLGTVDRAVELAVDHVNGRIQFGRPIAAFQSVQFALADASVAVAGLRELAHYTLWRPTLVDTLALRAHALDVARSVLRTTQQLHGAAGVCDEYDISVLIRLVQPALRLPWGAERTAEELAGAIARDGFDGLFEHGGSAG
jgi:alkylation response protein AidB-like acyl-CoA dehydrogenase